MKNARISFLLLSVFAFQKIECKKQQPAPKKAVTVKRAPTGKRPAVSKKAAVVVEQEAHKVEVNERALEPNEVVAPSVVPNTVENPDGSITETIVTVTPIEEEGKVITKTETWTWYDAAKIALGVGAATGAAYLAYQNNEDFRNGVNAVASWSADSVSNTRESLSSWWNGQSPETQAAVIEEFKTVAINNPEVVVDAAAAKTQQAIDNALAQGVDPNESSDVIADRELEAEIAEYGIENLSETQWNGLGEHAAFALSVAGGIFIAKVPAARAAIAKHDAMIAQGDWYRSLDPETYLMKVIARMNRAGASTPTGVAGHLTQAGESLKDGAKKLDYKLKYLTQDVPFTEGSNATQSIIEGTANWAVSLSKAKKEAAIKAEILANRTLNEKQFDRLRDINVFRNFSQPVTKLSAQSAAGFKSNNNVNGTAETVSSGLAKLTATQSRILAEQAAAQSEKAARFAGAAQPIDYAAANAILKSSLEAQQIARDNGTQALKQMENQTRIAQQIGLTGANVGIAGAVAAGANVLNNSDMSAPANNIDYAVEFN